MRPLPFAQIIPLSPVSCPSARLRLLRDRSHSHVRVFPTTLSTGHHKCLPSLTPRAQEDKLEAGGERRCEDPNPLIPLPLRLKKSSNLNISFGLTQPRKRWPCVPVSLSEPISTQKRATNRLLTLLARLTAPCAPGALAGSRRIR